MLFLKPGVYSFVRIAPFRSQLPRKCCANFTMKDWKFGTAVIAVIEGTWFLYVGYCQNTGCNSGCLKNFSNLLPEILAILPSGCPTVKQGWTACSKAYKHTKKYMKNPKFSNKDIAANAMSVSPSRGGASFSFEEIFYVPNSFIAVKNLPQIPHIPPIGTD